MLRRASAKVNSLDATLRSLRLPWSAFAPIEQGGEEGAFLRPELFEELVFLKVKN